MCERFLCFLPVHNRRWFKLIGNLLFYLKSEVPVSGSVWWGCKRTGSTEQVRGQVGQLAVCAHLAPNWHWSYPFLAYSYTSLFRTLLGQLASGPSVLIREVSCMRTVLYKEVPLWGRYGDSFVHRCMSHSVQCFLFQAVLTVQWSLSTTVTDTLFACGVGA